MLSAPMIDLNSAYQQLARPWSHEQLAAHYGKAKRRGTGAAGHDEHALGGPIALLAASIPRASSLNVAVHVLHVLPSTTGGSLAPQLLNTIDDNATAVLNLCHRALELDGRAHNYTAEEWLPAVYDIAAELLQGAGVHQEPPSVVEHAQDAVRWLSRAIISLDQDSPDTPAAITDALGCLLAVCAFANAARELVTTPDG
jgi:hypothetical protein